MKQDTKELMYLVFWDNHKFAGGFKEIHKRGKVVGYEQLFNDTLDLLYIQPELFEYQSIKAMTEKDWVAMTGRPSFEEWLQQNMGVIK